VTSEELMGFVPVATPSAMLLLAVLMILRGALVPRSVLQTMIADREKVITEQAAHITTLTENNAILRTGNQTTIRVVESLPRVAGSVQ
jgi:hypothetical protein